MLAGLANIPGISFFPPQGAFYVMMDVSQLIGKKYEGKEITDDTSFAELLLEHQGVSVVPGDSFFAPGTCRLSYAISEARIDEAMARLKAFVSGLS